MVEHQRKVSGCRAVFVERPRIRSILRVADFSDPGQSFQGDGGQAQRARVPGIIVAQVSGISLKASELSTLASIAGVGNSAPKAMVFAPSTMQTCPRRWASLATNARRGGQVVFGAASS